MDMVQIPEKMFAEIEMYSCTESTIYTVLSRLRGFLLVQVTVVEKYVSFPQILLNLVGPASLTARKDNRSLSEIVKSLFLRSLVLYLRRNGI